MDREGIRRIPNRADTLRVLRLIGDYRPLLMLRGNDDGYGTRWVLDGQQVEPAIARYLMESEFLIDTGATEFGARNLTLTPLGRSFREKGLVWWESLNWLERVRVTLFG